MTRVVKKITRSEAYKEIARIVYPEDPLEKAAERIRQRAYRAGKAGKIIDSPLVDQSFSNWVRETWPNRDDLPSWLRPRAHDLSARDGFGVGEHLDGVLLPPGREALEARYGECCRSLDAALAARAKAEQALQAEREARQRAEYRLKNRLQKQSDAGKDGGRGKAK